MGTVKSLISCLVFLACFAVFAEPASFQKDYESAQKLIEDGKYRVAASKLEKLSADRKLGDAERGQTVILLAQAYRKDGRPQNAVDVLEKLSIGRGDMYWLELGEAYLSLKDFDKAADAAQSYGSSKSVSLKADGAWLRARAEYGRKAYKPCYVWCDSFKRAVESARAEAVEKGAAELDHLKYFDPLLTEARKLKEQARELYETEMYGRDFANYRKGRSAQMEGDWTNAIFHYRCVKGGTLKDASDCYAAQCVATRGDFKDAEKLYEDFIKASPLGLYREEASLRLAELRIAGGKGDSCLRDALDDVDKLIGSLPKIRENDSINVKLEGLNQAIEDDIISAAPKEPSHADDCGNLIRYAKCPETIDNRLTSPWYLAEIETRAWLLKGFLHGELGQRIDAANAYKYGTGVSEQMKILANADAGSDLLASLADGAYLLPAGAGGKLKGRGGRLLNYACFLLMTERLDEAKKVLAMAEDEFGRSCAPYEEASINLVKAELLLSERPAKRKDAEKILFSLYSTKRYRKLPHWPMAAFFYANSISANQADKTKVYALYKEIAADEARSDYAPRALMALAAYSTNLGDRKLAVDICTEVRNKYVKTPYKDAAVTLREALRQSDGSGQLIEPVELPEGAVRIHNRTIVYPGGSKWQPPLDGLKIADIALYNVKFIGRDNCTVITKVGMTMPFDEPQIPSANGNQLLFVRIPILYVKSLRYDFDELFKKKEGPPAATTSPEGKS